MRVLGVDPGAEHVGISIWEVDDEDNPYLVDSYELNPRAFAFFVHSPKTLESFDEVWAENYVPQGGFGDSKYGTETIKLLGYLIWECRVRCDCEVNLVTRMDRDASLRRLKHAGWGFGGVKSGHAKDAQAVVVAGKKWRIGQLLH